LNNIGFTGQAVVSSILSICCHANTDA